MLLTECWHRTLFCEWLPQSSAPHHSFILRVVAALMPSVSPMQLDGL